MTSCTSCTTLLPHPKARVKLRRNDKTPSALKKQRLFYLSVEKNLIPDMSFTITERAATEESYLHYRPWKGISMEGNSPSFLHKAPALTFYKEHGQHNCPERQCAAVRSAEGDLDQQKFSAKKKKFEFCFPLLFSICHQFEETVLWSYF